MAIELPGELIWVMDLLGLNWPAVNEDSVREYAGHVRAFASDIDSAHDQASATIRRMGQAYQAPSYDKLVETWDRMSSSHMTELVGACGVVAIALDVAADMIVAAKTAVLVELGVVAAQLAAAAAAAVATLGAAAAAEAALIQVSKKIVNEILERLEQEIIAHLVEKAITPLEEVVERALRGLVFKGIEKAVESASAAAGANAGRGFSVHPEELLKCAAELRGHADEVVGHAKKFTTASAGVSFS